MNDLNDTLEAGAFQLANRLAKVLLLLKGENVVVGDVLLVRFEQKELRSRLSRYGPCHASESGGFAWQVSCKRGCR